MNACAFGWKWDWRMVNEQFKIWIINDRQILLQCHFNIHFIYRNSNTIFRKYSVVLINVMMRNKNRYFRLELQIKCEAWNKAPMVLYESVRDFSKFHTKFVAMRTTMIIHSTYLESFWRKQINLTCWLKVQGTEYHSTFHLKWMF